MVSAAGRVPQGDSQLVQDRVLLRPGEFVEALDVFAEVGQRPNGLTPLQRQRSGIDALFLNGQLFQSGRPNRDHEPAEAGT